MATKRAIPQEELRIVGPWTADSGYSHFARAALRTALLAGYKVAAIESDYSFRNRHLADGRIIQTKVYQKRPAKFPLPKEQAKEVRIASKTIVSDVAPTLFIQFPEQLVGWNEYSSGPRIGWTMQESDRMNETWKMCLEGVDIALAPSKYVFDTFRRDSPNVRTEFLPLPVDDRLWSPVEGVSGFNRRNLPNFLFFSVFSTIPRKGWQVLLQAFAEEFCGEDVGLIVKPSRFAEVGELARWLSRKKAKTHYGDPYRADVWIQVLTEPLKDSDLADLYRLCDCYALPSCEGFGLPYVEAALCGKASVALNLGGSADIVNEDTGYPCPAYFAPCIGQLPHVYDSTHLFAQTDINSLRGALRRAYEGERPKTPRGDPDRIIEVAVPYQEPAVSCALNSPRVAEGLGSEGTSEPSATAEPSEPSEPAGPSEWYTDRDLFGRAEGTKGEAARLNALANYTPEVLAPKLRGFIDEARIEFNTRRRFWPATKLTFRRLLADASKGQQAMSITEAEINDPAPEWGIVMGDGYGDGLAVLGNIQKALEEIGGSCLGVIHYGKNKGLDTFLADQLAVREVVRVEPEDREEYMKFCNLAGAFYTDVPERWLPELLERLKEQTGREIDWRTVLMTQVHWPWGAWPINRPKEVIIPDECYEWARAKREELGEFVLVQPFSTNSVNLNDHWFYWTRAIKWLLERVDLPLVFCGLEPIPGLRGDNVVDLVGKTPSMQHVFALAEESLACFTTCNALGLWTAVKNVPALVVANLAIADPNFFFYRWQNTARNVMVPYQSSFEEWETAAKDFASLYGIKLKEKEMSGSETSKHRNIVAPYCQGNGVDLGSAGDPVVPWAIQVDLPDKQYRLYNLTRNPDVPIQWRGSALELPFKDETLDFVHSSHLLEDFEDWQPILAEWDRTIKPFGFIMIAVPDHERFRAYVQRGKDNGIDCDNLSHRRESRIGEVAEELAKIGKYKTMYDGFVNDKPDEFSLLYMGQKVLG